MRIHHAFLTLATVFFTYLPVSAQDLDNSESDFRQVTGKKLIEYGWDVPTPEYIRDNIREMEKRPFEGLIFRLPSGGGDVFNIETWEKNRKLIEAQRKILPQIKWGKFRDNFLAMYAASNMDWFSDADWRKVLAHVQFCAEAARLAGCKGIKFDPEPYGFNPWDYAKQKHADRISYEDYSAKARQRGREFMQAMMREMPELKLLMFFQYSTFYHVAHNADEKQRRANVQGYNYYNLMLPFLDGLLEAAGKNVQLVDGNEPAYYYTKPLDFYKSYWIMRQGAKLNVSPSLREKFDSNVRAANALYVDHLFNLGRDSYYVAAGMTDEERARWFEQNTYYALQSSDEYVWLYSERINWWKNENLPPGLEAAIVSAKQKLRDGKELGFEMESTFKTAQVRLSQILQEKLLRRTARAPRLKTEQVPKIDGKTDETVYRDVKWLDDFVGFINVKGTQEVTAATRAWVAHDARNLYLAFRCEESAMDKQRIPVAECDGLVWNGECLEFSILKPGQDKNDPAAQYYHFMLSPHNVQWDSLDEGTQTNTAAFNPQWQSAVTRDASGWTAEIALPWSQIGLEKVEAGRELRMNLARQRLSEKTEHSSWSGFIAGFQEPQNFGTVVFE